MIPIGQHIADTALTWVGTPYRAHACEKNVGCDCASLLLGVAQEIGIVSKDYKIGNYSINAAFMVAGGDFLYLTEIGRYTREITEAEVQPGDFVLYKLGRGFSHGAVIIKWPDFVVHAVAGYGVTGCHGSQGTFVKKARKFFRFVGEQ